MKYVNSDTGKTIGLGKLSPEESAFLKEAKSRFQENENWIEFENFAFGLRSPIYRRANHQIRLGDFPLFQALKDMHLHLEAQQASFMVKKNTRPKKER